MAPSAARARKAARRAQEEAAAAEMALHTTPSAGAALEQAELSEVAAAKDEERAEHQAEEGKKGPRERADLTAYCMACGSTDAGAFSARMLNKRGRHGDRMRRCKQCVAVEQAQEANDSTEAEGQGLGKGDGAEVACTSCERPRPAGAFSRSQLRKLEQGGVARCLECVAAALAQG